MNNQLTLFDRDSDYLESSVKDFDSKTASFRVHASLIYKLGESLIADEITALSELLKTPMMQMQLFARFPLVQITLKKSTVKSARDALNYRTMVVVWI